MSDRTIYCDDDGERFGTAAEMIEEIKSLREKVVRTCDGVPVTVMDFVYTVFPGDKMPTALRVMSLSARTNSFEQFPVYTCFYTPEAAVADSVRRGIPEAQP